ncbi:MAG: hypothetical protein OEM52_02115 [bacterium]|nr:hypothetical protein [bacterium]
MPISDKMIERILQSAEPSVRWRALTAILGESPNTPSVKRMRILIKQSDRTRRLLAGCTLDDVYAKWHGAHWSLVLLAELGYPVDSKELYPLREAVLNHWIAKGKNKHYVRVIDGRVRTCASQEGNALFATCTLGIADSRCDELAANLLQWQWNDGGWNCDKHPAAIHSSFHESISPLRGLIAYANWRNDESARAAVIRAAELFLSRKLYRRLTNDQIIDHHFTKLHYPSFWHYDILLGLRVLCEGGFLLDLRSQPALELLQSKMLPDGGFPCEEKWYQQTKSTLSGFSQVDWGGTSKIHANVFVTVEALAVLQAANMLPIAKS